MYPREQLKQCFKCRNNIKCWQLDKEIATTQSEKDIIISIDKYVKNVKRIQAEYKLVNIAEFMGMANMILVQTLYPDIDSDYLRETIYNSMFIVFAMCNTTNNDWMCPDGYTFESE